MPRPKKVALKKEAEEIVEKINEPVYPTEKEILDKEHSELSVLLEDLRSRGFGTKQDIELRLSQVNQRLLEIGD